MTLLIPDVLRRVPDVTLLRLQTSTLALDQRTDEDLALLDAIGREWLSRKCSQEAA